MTAKKLNDLIIIFLLIFASTVLEAQPQSFSITYKFTDSNGTNSRMIKYFMSEGIKFRSEYYSNIQFNITANAEGKMEDSTISGKVDAELKSENAPASQQPHTIEILRNDKKLVWTMDPSFKNYSEVPLRQDSWERAAGGILMPDDIEFKKMGESKIFGYPCSIYENNQKIAEDSWTNTFYAADNLKVILKSELKQNGKLVQTMEASEFSTNKPDDSLFEVPQNYQKASNNPQGE